MNLKINLAVIVPLITQIYREEPVQLEHVDYQVIWAICYSLLGSSSFPYIGRFLNPLGSCGERSHHHQMVEPQVRDQQKDWHMKKESRVDPIRRVIGIGI